ncbi:hypothetical protein ABGB16_20585 [Micromonospora sp. B11E3]|uniref:hypothetical protein n=1 Tax=Micromonospora sp. B11E3 TaxID=3153562 RepID=UPI00325F6354
MNSFFKLAEAAGSASEEASHLLRFYSVECGMKAAALLRGKLQTTDQLSPDLLSHDLRRLASHLRLSPAEYQMLAPCRRRTPGAAQPTVEVPQLHQAWRYGAKLDAEDEKTAVAGLTSLGNWCRKETR